MRFDPTLESVRTHRIPGWLHDAKLGIFIHWGPNSVPGWAPRNGLGWLLGLGCSLAVNGKASYGSPPWANTEGQTTDAAAFTLRIEAPEVALQQ